MLRRIAQRARTILADQRGAVFVEYSSLVLLIAIAALALLTHVAAVPD